MFVCLFFGGGRSCVVRDCVCVVSVCLVLFAFIRVCVFCIACRIVFGLMLGLFVVWFACVFSLRVVLCWFFFCACFVCAFYVCFCVCAFYVFDCF